MDHPMSVRIDGREPETEALAGFATRNEGHFTVMQVRRGGVRGLDIHLDRLAEAHEAVYGMALDTDRVRSLARSAVVGRADATLRIVVSEREGAATIMTVAGPPRDPHPDALSLLPVEFVRAFPEVKHLGTFPQLHWARRAQVAGFDDAVFTHQGLISETTAANIAFVTNDAVLWPEAPVLRGVTWRLLARELPRHGLQARSAPVDVRDVDRHSAAIVMSSTGIAPVAAIGSHRFEHSEESARWVSAILDAVEPDRI